MEDNQIKVFVSYSHDDADHIAWVSRFVKDLRNEGGFEVLYDQDLEKGASLPRFMESGISNSDKVLVIGTPEYKRKATVTSGIGFEEAIIGTEYMVDLDSTKFYPILRRGTFSTSFPMILAGRNGDDFTDDSQYEENLKTVIRSIIGKRNINGPLSSQIVNLCTLSDTFPQLPPDIAIIDRDSEIEQIESLLGSQNEKKAVFVSGQDGVGVTTLLALIANRHPLQCISFFNNGYTRYSVHPDVVEQSLAKQAYFYIYDTPLQEGMTVRLNSLFLKLLQKTKTDSLYFVFDGFEDVPVEYIPGLKEVFDKLPWGFANFVFSGDQNTLSHLLPSVKKSIKTETANKLLPFSKPRVQEYFRKLDPILSNADIDELYDICRGYADKIGVLRSLFLKNRSFAPILQNKVFYSKTIYYAEISRLEDSGDEMSFILLAVIAFSDVSPSIGFLQSVLEKTRDEVIELIGKNSDFLRIDDEEVVSYRSEALLKYMRGYLEQYQQRVEMRLISVYESNQALYADSLLPLYKKLHQNESLIHLLSDNNIQNSLDLYRSQSSLNVQCDFGYEAANEESYLGDALRFSVLRSTSRQIELNELWDYETEALVVQGKIDEAISLTEIIYLKEERLKSLAIIAKKAKGLPIEKKDAILMAIHKLAQSISFEKIPNKSLELARLLLGVDLQISMEIIERLVNDEKNNLSLDSIYAMLSLSLKEDYLSDTDSSDTSSYEKVKAKIQDSEIRKMTDAMSLLYSKVSSDEVLKTARELASETQRIYFLMFWIPGHRSKEGIEKIVLYALGLVVANSNIDIPRNNIVQGLCKALPYFSNLEDVEKVRQMLESIETDIKTPTLTYIQVKLLLIEALAKFDEAKAFAVLEDVYLYVDELTDFSISIDCLSLILSSYERLGDKKYLEKHFATQNELLNQIKKRLLETFAYTAYHFNLIKNPIRFLVVDYPSFISDLVPMMNTESRRSKAYVYGAREYIRRCPIEKYKWDYLDKLLTNIQFRSSDVEMPVSELALKISRSPFSDALLAEIKKRQSLFCSLQDENSRCHLLAELYVWVYKEKPDEPFAAYLLKQLFGCWQAMVSVQERIDVGFHLVTIITSYNQSVGEEILNRTLELKERVVFSSSSCMEALEESLDLYTRSVGIMIKAGFYDEQVLEKYKNELDRLDDVGIRIISWGKIALEFYTVSDKKGFDKVVYNQIVLPLEKLNKGTSYYHFVLYSVAPAIFLYSEHSYSQYMEGLDEFFINACASHACDFIFYKYPYLSDLEFDKNDIQLDYREYQQLLSLLSYMTYDDVLFNKIDNISKSLYSGRNCRISQTQVVDIAKRIRDIADKKFPAPTGISHDGYKVACYIATHELLNHSNARNLWDTIDEQIKKIDNKSDQAFLYFYALQYMSRKPHQLDFLKKGVDINNTIPIGFDRLTRFDMALEECLKYCKPQVKELLTNVMNSVRFETSDEYDFFERFTDVAYQYDSNFADQYIEVADKDAARRYNRKALSLHVASQKRLKAADTDISKAISLPSREYSRFFNKMFSSVVRGKVIAQHPQQLSHLIPSIYERQLSVTKNTVLYFMEDVRRWHDIHNDQKDLVLKLYSSLAFNFRMVEALSVNSKASLDRLIHAPSRPNDSIIRPGEREKGLSVLYEWYKKHNTKNLRIIDPYFSAQDLLDLKPLFEYNPDLHVSIVAHAKNEDSVKNYKEVWEENVSNIRDSIDVITVCFAEKPDEGPLHDRYWFAQDRGKGVLVGIKTTSLSNLGKRDSDSEIITDDRVNQLYDNLWSFYSDKERQIGGHSLIYQSISF